MQYTTATCTYLEAFCLQGLLDPTPERKKGFGKDIFAPCLVKDVVNEDLWFDLRLAHWQAAGAASMGYKLLIFIHFHCTVSNIRVQLDAAELRLTTPDV
jgi:hypothetical protein